MKIFDVRYTGNLNLPNYFLVVAKTEKEAKQTVRKMYGMPYKYLTAVEWNTLDYATVIYSTKVNNMLN